MNTFKDDLLAKIAALKETARDKIIMATSDTIESKWTGYDEALDAIIEYITLYDNPRKSKRSANPRSTIKKLNE